MGSLVVSLLIFLRGEKIKNDINSIARSIDSKEDFQFFTDDWPQNLEIDGILNSPHVFDSSEDILSNNSSVIVATPPVPSFNPVDQLTRLFASVATLGSGCSLGPEGPSVELGAGVSRLISGSRSTSPRERHHLFLAGTAAGVSAGFNAPIAGVFFAIECGNRYLSKNTIRLDEDAPDGPRLDIAAIVLSAAIADLVVGFGLNQADALAVQGNEYRMVSPIFELTLYLGLGLVSGTIAVTTK